VTISQREFREAANRRRSGVTTRLPRLRITRGGRHARKCAVCRHPQREEIEVAFLLWHNPSIIAADFGLADRRNLYRHAQATGLHALRLARLRCAVDMIVEHAHNVVPNANHILKAIYTASHINNRGQWIERPAVVRVDSNGKTSEISRNPVSPTIPISVPGVEPVLNLKVSGQGVQLNSNRHIPVRLEIDGNA
jgi:hypothetical protein